MARPEVSTVEKNHLAQPSANGPVAPQGATKGRTEISESARLAEFFSARRKALKIMAISAPRGCCFGAHAIDPTSTVAFAHAIALLALVSQHKMSCQGCLVDPKCTVTRQQLEKGGIFVGQKCPECNHAYGQHPNSPAQPEPGKY